MAFGRLWDHVQDPFPLLVPTVQTETAALGEPVLVTFEQQHPHTVTVTPGPEAVPGQPAWLPAQASTCSTGQALTTRSGSTPHSSARAHP